MKRGNTDPSQLERVSRRGFWRVLLREAFTTVETVKGKATHRLSELASLDDETLSGIRPVLNPEYELIVEDGQVFGMLRDTDTRIPLFPLEDRYRAVFNRFDGRHTIRGAAKMAAQELDWDYEQAWSFSRDLFLRLAANLVLVPRDPLPTV